VTVVVALILLVKTVFDFMYCVLYMFGRLSVVREETCPSVGLRNYPSH
jgi:hypothetical protein